MQHRVLVDPITFNFTSYPIQVTTNVATNITWSATSSGAVIAGSGVRLWDTALLPASGSQLVSPGSPLVMPFSTANLPNVTFDAIVVIGVNGTIFPQGFSNSPDNDGSYLTSPTTANKELFWADLFAFGLNNTNGNPTSNGDYLFGGTPSQMGLATPIYINFANSLEVPLTANYKIEYYQLDLGQVGVIFTGSSTLTPGSRRYLLDTRSFVGENYNANGYFPYNYKGYLKVSLTVDNTNFRSLLPYYHWGCS